MAQAETVNPDSLDEALEWLDDGELRIDSAELNGDPLTVHYDSGNTDRLFLWENQGEEFLIASDSWESAWECAVDESETVPLDEVFEAYGFESEAEFQAVGRWCNEADPRTARDRQVIANLLHRLRTSCDVVNWNGRAPESPEELTEYPSVGEGYEYQANSSGSGIVSTLYAALREVDESDFPALVLNFREW